MQTELFLCKSAHNILESAYSIDHNIQQICGLKCILFTKVSAHFLQETNLKDDVTFCLKDQPNKFNTIRPKMIKASRQIVKCHISGTILSYRQGSNIKRKEFVINI